MKRSGRALDRMSPRRQTSWDARAATNFICGGAGGGLLAATALASPLGVDLRPLIVLGLALVGLGLLAVWLEIGRPLRALNVYRNVATSWMTREALVATLLFAAGGAAVVLDRPAAVWLAGLSGVGLVYAQGRILRNQKGIPAWRHGLCTALVVATGLTEGAGLLVVAALIWPALTPFGVLLAILAAARLVVWRRYRESLRGVGVPVGTLKAFDAIDGPFVWVGHAVPIGLGIAGALLGWPIAVALAGAAAVGTGAWFKFVLICRAALTQGFALPQAPARGSGRPGVGARPGWSRAKAQ
ncbi:MAG: dimethyl sulfoxide reductase anchor subunit [Rhodovulum sp.]|nr:dimethyl sulfoxide reductase anchor subunit [Rhodovulum sp.]